MSTATPIYDELVIEHLDFEPSIPCSLRAPGCEEVATVLIVCRRCRCGSPCCGHCLVLLREAWEAFKADPKGAFALCIKCLTPTTDFDALWVVVPIKGGDS